MRTLETENAVRSRNPSPSRSRSRWPRRGIGTAWISGSEKLPFPLLSRMDTAAWVRRPKTVDVESPISIYINRKDERGPCQARREDPRALESSVARSSQEDETLHGVRDDDVKDGVPIPIGDGNSQGARCRFRRE